VRVSYRESAREDLIRQFRYYLVTLTLPGVAVRFRDAVQHSVKSLRQHPHAGPQYPLKNPRLQNLRTWPVAGFEAIRIYYFVEEDTIHVVRILHGKRDVRGILEREESV
jgi:toxin ParE1/3/4